MWEPVVAFATELRRRAPNLQCDACGNSEEISQSVFFCGFLECSKCGVQRERSSSVRLKQVLLKAHLALRFLDFVFKDVCFDRFFLVQVAFGLLFF